MEKIISEVLKSTLFPLLTQQLYNAGKDIGKYDN